MSYHRRSLSGIARTVVRAGSSTMVALDPTASELRAEALRLKPTWPRCDIETTDYRTTPPTKTVRKSAGYLYAYSDVSMCQSRWDINEAVNVLAGRARVAPPQGPLDLSRVVPGTSSYYTWLCRAQGDGPEQKRVQEALTRAGLTWIPDKDIKSRNWNGYPSAPHPVIHGQNIMQCAQYVKTKAGNVGHWPMRAYQFSISTLNRAPGDYSGTNFREHRPSKCKEDPRIPPAMIPACEAALASGRTTLEEFVRDMQEGNVPFIADPEQRAKQQKLMLYGAIAFAGILTTALVIKKRKK